MTQSRTPYIVSLGTLLEAHADPVYAVSMEKYMRNRFKFFGIKSPLRKELFREFIRKNAYPPKKEMDEICRELYSLPEREFHYFAMEMVEKNLRKFNKEDYKLFEFMIVSNAWWDTVDFIAAGILGRFFRMVPDFVTKLTKEWMDSGNIWLQRSCILFQLKYKKDTDTELLYSFIEKLTSSNEFFIQKSIGWALREYSKVNPLEVLRFTERTELKPLSRREALRIIKKKGIITV